MQSRGPPGGGPLLRLAWRYGSVNDQALRPCVAATSLRAAGAIVRPELSTIGRSAAGDGPRRAGAGRQPHHAEVGRGVEVAGHVVVRDVGDREIGEVVADVQVVNVAGPVPVQVTSEHVTGLRRGVEVVARVRDPGAMRVRGVDGDSR